ncbi:UNVERIFIED_CONTAM: hypothetical protein FKN15_011426 [Acipenser sinensis]
MHIQRILTRRNIDRFALQACKCIITATLTAKVSRKLTFLYLANDVIQNSKRKGPEFTKDFAPVIVDAFKHVASASDEGSKKHLERVFSIWQERAVYENDLLDQLKEVLQGGKKPKKRPYEEIKVKEDDYPCPSSPADSPQTVEIIKALQELENAASGDAAVRKRISSLPLEVQDASLLDRITDKESGERLSRMVDDACLLLADYNGRLAAEIDDRKQLTRTLTDFLRTQKEILTEKEQKLEGSNKQASLIPQGAHVGSCLHGLPYPPLPFFLLRGRESHRSIRSANSKQLEKLWAATSTDWQQDDVLSIASSIGQGTCNTAVALLIRGRSSADRVLNRRGHAV